MAETKPKGAQGKRYTAEQKAEITKFIKQFNARKKRGGMKAAAEKYGVSAVTLSAWMKKAGKRTRKPAAKPAQPKVASKKAAKVVKRPRRKVTTPKPAKKGVQATLDRMSEIYAEIARLQKEFNTLKKKL